MGKKSRRQREADALGDEMVKRMEEIGVQPQIIYAYKKTGFLMTESNRHHMPQDQVDEWNEAIDEYFALYENGDADS